MTGFTEVRDAVEAAGLDVVGGFHPGPEDAPQDGPEDGLQGIGTLLLLGPGGPRMWRAFQASAEAEGGAADPLDRWSRRIVGALAETLGARAFFPFGGPPWHPFQRWAKRGEAAVGSPVIMQATPGRGLWASYRGALGFAETLNLPAWETASPCAPCPAPCRTACPVDAFQGGTYDVPRCTAHVQSPEGAACRDGCLVRRACPAGAGLDLPPDQRRFHMAAFLRANG